MTGLIAVLATWMAAGLLARQGWRLESLASIGLSSPRWPTALGAVLLVAVAALVVGWWVRPIGVAGIIVIKLSYLLMLVGYRRAGISRRKDAVNLAMTAHSLLSIALIIAW
ncbi:MAG: hypothetical protein ACRBK7_18400 [Acidimicrobiales bacterium]